jgi:hypothetical protein
MMPMETGTPRRRSIDAWATLLLLALAFILILAVYTRVLFPNYLLGPFRVFHWLGWIGALYIALSIPAYHLLKRRHPKRYLALLRLHTFGNLASAALVSAHVTQQLTRATLPDLATGLTLILIIALLVSTGIVMRFFGGTPKARGVRFLHIGVTIAFYLDLLVHVLHGLGYI